VIDLAAGEGEVCKAAVELRKPCLAFCFNDLHVRLLFDHLVGWMHTNMEDQKSVFYNVAYKSFKTGEQKDNDGIAAKAKENPLSAPPPASKRKSSGGTENKKKKTRKQQNDSNDEDEDESSSDDE